MSERWRLYKKAGASARTLLFLRAREALTPYASMAEYLPKTGRILDLGCGHGLFSRTLAEESKQRVVVGIDHDSDRVQLASGANSDLSNLSFEKGSLLAPPPGPWDGIAAIDVFHYFEPKVQNAILSSLRGALSPGGVLILREVDPGAGLISKLNRAYERVATGSGFTKMRDSHEKSLHFRAPSEWMMQLEKSGFTARKTRCSSALFADILFIGTT